MPALLWICFTLVLLFIIGVGCCYLWVSRVARPYLYNEIETLPFRKTALLLGTAKFTRHGYVNLFFTRRVAKAVEIYQHHKTEALLISGADKIPGASDEVDHMYEILTALGIPPAHVIKDHKGNRTWNSMWRCKHHFKTADPLIVSQRFHNERAVFIGLRMGMSPIAVNASKIRGTTAIRMFFREGLARVKCLMDCYLWNPEPVKEDPDSQH